MDRNDKGQYLYWSAKHRIMHIFLFLAATVSVVSGIPLKYYDLDFGKVIFDFFGSYKTITLIHSAVGMVIIFIVLSHIATLIFVWMKTEKFLSIIRMKFEKKDIESLKDLFKHLLLFKKRPKYGKYSIFAKLDYYISIISLLILSLTGFMLMFPVASASFVSKSWLTISLHIHSSLSIFFIVYIFTCHIFNTHVHPGKLFFNTVWITGTLTDQDMMTWHGLEYDEITQSERDMEEDYKRKSEEKSEEAKVKKEKGMLEDYLKDGNILAKAGNYADAIKKYNEAIKIYPNFSQARFNLGVALKKNNQFKEAINTFNEFVEMDPFNEMVEPAKKSIKELTAALRESEKETAEESSPQESPAQEPAAETKIENNNKDIDGKDN